MQVQADNETVTSVLIPHKFTAYEVIISFPCFKLAVGIMVSHISNHCTHNDCTHSAVHGKPTIWQQGVTGPINQSVPVLDADILYFASSFCNQSVHCNAVGLVHLPRG